MKHFSRIEHIVKELREQGRDPDHHPMIRALFMDAADLIELLAKAANDAKSR